jgi:multicomponent K+:H+ antiporter subunit G
MNGIETLPAWAALLTSVLLIVGSGLALLGSIGLLRFKTFYERVHAPTLASTLGLFTILAASMVYFSVAKTRPVVHEILIAVFVSTTTPITFLMLVGAALYRDRYERNDPLDGLTEDNPRVLSPQDPTDQP